MISVASHSSTVLKAETDAEGELTNGVTDPFPARIPEPRILWMVSLGAAGH